MEIKLSKSAAKYLKALQPRQREAITNAIQGLVEKPPRGDIKLMQGYNDTRYRLRVGKYRVIYRYDSVGGIEVLYVLNIGARGDIYK